MSMKELKKLTAAGNEKKSKKSSGVPENDAYAALFDKIRSKYEEQKNILAEFEVLKNEGQLVARVEYEKNAKDGNFSKSMSFVGSKTSGMMATFMDRFSTFGDDIAEALVARIGKKNFGKYFEERPKVSLKKDVDMQRLAKLLKTIGEEVFTEYLEVTTEYVAREDMDRKQFELSDEDRVLLRQAACALKPLKE